MGFVRQQRTIVTLDDLAPALIQAFDVYQLPVEAIDIAIVFGKIVAECGWPGPSQCCWNWNVGNLRGSSVVGNYTVLAGAYEFAPPDRVPTGAVLIPTPAHATAPAGTVCYLPTNPDVSQRFGAYADLVHGCAEYVAKLHDRFKAAFHTLDLPGSTPAGFVAALHDAHYFTGDATAYTRNVQSGAAWALPRVRGGVATLPAPPPAAMDAPTTDPGGRFDPDGGGNPIGWEDRAAWDRRED